MAISYRKMQAEDIIQVQTLIPVVFAELFSRETGRPHFLPKRTRPEVASYMDKDPEGAFVAVTERGKVIGCVFCHRWGETGWLGPIVVSSSFQGQGIGSRLLQMATEHMKNTQCKIIGLETMPQTIANVGLYLRHGYFPQNLRIRLGKEIDSRTCDDQGKLIYCLDLAEAKKFLNEAARISRSVDPHLDYSKEIEATFRFELGRCFFWQEQERIRGFMLYHWMPASSRVVIKAMACDPGEDTLKVFRMFLTACEQVLAEEGIRQIIAPVYGDYTQVLDILMRSGYQVMHAGVRMLYRKEVTQRDLSGIVNLSQWSG